MRQLFHPDAIDSMGNFPEPSIPKEMIRTARELRAILMEPENAREQAVPGSFRQKFLKFIEQIKALGIGDELSKPGFLEGSTEILALKQFYLAERTLAMLADQGIVDNKGDAKILSKLQRLAMKLSLEQFIRAVESNN